MPAVSCPVCRTAVEMPAGVTGPVACPEFGGDVPAGPRRAKVVRVAPAAGPPRRLRAVEVADFDDRFDAVPRRRRPAESGRQPGVPVRVYVGGVVVVVAAVAAAGLAVAVRGGKPGGVPFAGRQPAPAAPDDPAAVYPLLNLTADLPAHKLFGGRTLREFRHLRSRPEPLVVVLRVVYDGTMTMSLHRFVGPAGGRLTPDEVLDVIRPFDTDPPLTVTDSTELAFPTRRAAVRFAGKEVTAHAAADGPDVVLAQFEWMPDLDRGTGRATGDQFFRSVRLAPQP